MAISESKKETINASVLAFSGNFIGKFVSIPVGIVVASILGPDGYGLLAIITLITQYLSYLNLGMLANISREVPIAYGKEDLEEVKTIYNTVFTNYIITTTIGLVALWLVYLFGFDYKGELETIHFIIITFIVLSSNSNSFLYSTVKGEGKFILYGQYEMFSRIAIPIVQVCLVYFLGLVGMLLSLVFQHLMSLVFLYFNLDRPSFTFRINISKTKELFSTGILMYINKIIDGIFISIGTIMAATYFASSEVGILSFALGFASINKVPFARILSVTISRKMAVEGGKHGIDNYARFSRYFGTPYVIYLFLLSTILGVLVIFYSIVVNIFLEKFLLSIPILILLYFALNFYNARYFLNSYINITRQMSKRTYILAAGAVINLALCYASVKLEYGIVGIGVAVGISMIVVSINTINYVYKQVFETWRSRIFVIGRIFIISLVLTATIYLFDNYNFISYGTDYSQIMEMLKAIFDFAIKAGLFSILSCLLYILLFRKDNVYRELKTLITHVFRSSVSAVKQKLLQWS